MILEYSPRRKDLISPADRGFLYGDGVFETMAVRGGKVCFFDEHFALLTKGAKVLGVKIPHSQTQIARKLRSAVAGSGIREGIARVIVTRGESSFGLSVANCVKPKVILWAQPAVLKSQTRGLKVGLSTLAIASSKIAPVKSLNYLVNLMAKKEGEEKGFDEMILCDTNGQVLSGTSSNLFLVSRDKLLTPPARLIRAGVTREHVILAARRLKMRVLEKGLSVKDVLTSDELFFTSSVSGIRWAQSFTSGKKVRLFERQITGL